MIEINGKKYIELKEERENLRRFFIQLFFLISLVIVSIALINATITIIKYRDLLTSDPVAYVKEKYKNFESCSCIDDKGNIWSSDGRGFNPNYKNFLGG